VADLLKQRFDAAIAAGGAVAAPAEASPHPRETRDPDRLRGRPFFLEVERRAGETAAERPTHWIAAGQSRLTQSEVAADAEGLRRQIMQEMPHTSVAVMRPEELLEALLIGSPDDLVDAVSARATADRTDGRREDLRELTATLVNNVAVDQTGNAVALNDQVREDGRVTGESVHLILAASPLQDPNQITAFDLDGTLRNRFGVLPQAGYRAPLTAAEEARYSNDHEFGHVLDYANGNLTEWDGPSYDIYRAECRADAFALAMAARRGDPVDRVAAHIVAERDIAACAWDDVEHWTPQAVCAVRKHLHASDAASRYPGMPLAEMMREVAAVAESRMLDEPAFDAFSTEIHRRATGAERDPALDPDSPGARAADEAFAGYATARIALAHGPAETLGEPDPDWAEAAWRARPRQLALADLGEAAGRFQQAGVEMVRCLSAPPHAPEQRARLARATDALAGRCAEFIRAAHSNREHLGSDGMGRRDPAPALHRLDQLRARSGAIAGAGGAKAALQQTEETLVGIRQALAVCGRSASHPAAGAYHLQDLLRRTRRESPGEAPRARQAEDAARA
jgi:hypothetical protein